MPTLAQAIALDDASWEEARQVCLFRRNEDRLQFVLRKLARGEANYFVGFKDSDPTLPYGLSWAVCPWVVEGGVYAKDLGGLVH